MCTVLSGSRERVTISRSNPECRMFVSKPRKGEIPEEICIERRRE